MPFPRSSNLDILRGDLAGTAAVRNTTIVGETSRSPSMVRGLKTASTIHKSPSACLLVGKL